MSAIQVFRGDKMVTVAHLIGPSTLGFEKVLGLNDVAEFKNRPWRGMVIKDNDGDWAIVAGAWKGMTSGKQPIPPGRGQRHGTAGKPGNPGYFKMIYYNLRTKVRETCVLPEGFTSLYSRHYKFEFENQLKVDLDKARITVHRNTPEFIQHVTLSFVSSLLYLMVLPRPKDDFFLENIPPQSNALRPLYMHAPFVGLLMICGYSYIDCIPANSTLRFMAETTIGASAAVGWSAAVNSHMRDYDVGFLDLHDEVGGEGVGDTSVVGGCGGCGAACGSTNLVDVIASMDLGASSELGMFSEGILGDVGGDGLLGDAGGGDGAACGGGGCGGCGGCGA